jgi:hypothetical protein
MVVAQGSWWGRQFMVAIPALSLRISTGAMFLALGYVSGHVIGVPLMAGAIVKYGVLDGLQHAFWSHSKGDDFAFALCSGIVAWSALLSMIHLARMTWTWLTTTASSAHAWSKDHLWAGLMQERSWWHAVVGASMLTITASYYLGLRPDLVVYVVGASALSGWYIAGIAQKTGLALVGRFATWVMLPGLLLYGVNPLYATLFSLGVEVCGMLTVDLLFNQMAASRAGLDRRHMRYWQIGGLLIALITCSIAFWWLMGAYGLSVASPLVAQRARSRALLLQVTTFDWSVVLLGMCVAIGMGFLGINSTMALAGILLPLDITLVLVLGGALRMLSRDPEHWTPFWSGLFAAGALVMSLKTFGL